MNEVHELVRRWVVKAENDLKAGLAILQVAQPPTDAVCFHMQQSVEKYLKAYLTLHQVPFRRTHILAELIEQCKELDATFDALYTLQADSLSIYGVEIRYVDDFYLPTLEEAEQSVRIARAVRSFVRIKLIESGFNLEEENL